MQELPCAKGEMVVSRGFTVSYLHELGERLPVEATTPMSWCCPIRYLVICLVHALADSGV